MSTSNESPTVTMVITVTYVMMMVSKPTKKSSMKRVRNSSSKSNKLATTNKSKVENNLVIYMKGVQFDLAKEASKRPIEFSRRLSSIVGKVGEVRLVIDRPSVRITCLNSKQKSVLLSYTD